MNNHNKADFLVPIENIKEDPTNPRVIFSQAHIEGLAKSLTQEGMINPIECDENFMIITGACRFRAAILLGWEEIPVRVNKSGYSEYERLRHQVAENYHQSGTSDEMLNAIDVAKAYARLFKLKTGKDTAVAAVSHKDLYGVIKEIATEIGVSEHTIHDYLKLLEAPEFVQKDIQKGRAKSFYIEAKRVPVELQERFNRRIANNEFKSAKEIRETGMFLKKFPELTVTERNTSKESFGTNRILNGVARLALALEAMPLKDIPKKEKEIIINQLKWLNGKIEAYLSLKGLEYQELMNKKL